MYASLCNNRCDHSGAIRASTTPKKADGTCAVPWQESDDPILHTRNYVNIADGRRIILNTEFDSNGDTWEYAFAAGSLTLVWDTTRDGKTRIHHHYAWRASFGGTAEKILALTSHLDGTPAHAYYETNGAEGGPVMTVYDPTDDFRNHFDKCAFDGTYAYCSREAVKLIKFDTTTKYCEISGTDKVKISGFGRFIPSRPGRVLMIDDTGAGNNNLWDPATCSIIKSTAVNEDGIAFDYDGDPTNGEEFLRPKLGGQIWAPDTGQVINLDSIAGAPPLVDAARNQAAPVDLIDNGQAEEIAVYNGTVWAIYVHPTASGTGNRWSDACYKRNVASGEYDTHPERNYACP